MSASHSQARFQSLHLRILEIKSCSAADLLDLTVNIYFAATETTSFT